VKGIDLSIAIVSYNTRDLTRRCLASIFDGNREITLDVCVVDNASTDGSADLIEREFPRARVIRNGENRGLAAATNQALATGAGRYLAALNSDTIVQPGALVRLVRFLDEHPAVGGATPRLIRPDGGKHPVFFGTAESPRWAILENLAGFSKRARLGVLAKRHGTIDLSRSQPVPCILCGTCFVVRREAYEQVGGQDPRFFIYGEDTDWSLRIWKAGWQQYYLADAEVVHFGGQSTKQVSATMQAQEMKSRCRLIQKHFGFFAGYTLRLVIAAMCGIRLLKWVVQYPIRPPKSSARAVMKQMLANIRAALTY